jgi:formate/nitrite transporter
VRGQPANGGESRRLGSPVRVLRPQVPAAEEPPRAGALVLPKSIAAPLSSDFPGHFSALFFAAREPRANASAAPSKLLKRKGEALNFALCGCAASLRDLAACWGASWAGNFAGCVFLAAIFVAGGGGLALAGKNPLILNIAASKMNAPALELVTRAMLCNWLVCLAIWTSARMTNDTAKCIAIFWCVYAFIGSGFEHSVANMTLLSIALLAEHPPTVTLGGLGWNLLWVTIGNAISGAGIVGLGYWTASRAPAEADLRGLWRRVPARKTRWLTSPRHSGGSDGWTKVYSRY